MNHVKKKIVEYKNFRMSFLWQRILTSIKFVKTSKKNAINAEKNTSEEK